MRWPGPEPCQRVRRTQRAKFATSTRLASLRKGEFDPDAIEERWWRKERKTPITPTEAFFSGALAFGISFVLFNVSGLVQDYLDNYAVPNQATVRNVFVALKTAVEGLSYLLSFMFAANAAGLAMMAPAMIVPVSRAALVKR